MMAAADDRWSAGDAYEAFMGRWSRPLARAFLEWLRPKPSGHWLDVGCGTGALASTICERCEPASVVACDPSEPFIEDARSRNADARASFVVAAAQDLPAREGGFDAVVSGLVLNFLPEPEKALAAMRERLRPGGFVAAYVWDYADGMQFLRHFWDEAIALDSAAGELDEGRRFPLCRPEALASLFRAVGLREIRTEALEVTTEFADFGDYWRPFLGRTGPAPAYVTSLDPARRESLRARLRQRLPVDGDGRIRLSARAWAVRGFAQ